MRILVLLLWLLPNLALAATSNVFTSPHGTVTLISPTDTPASPITLALRFRLAPGWHIYWQNPGEAGLAPQITLAPPATASAFSFPPPELLSQDGVTAYVLSGDILLPFTATHAGATITAHAAWLVCANICIPEHASFTLTLSGGPASEAGLFKPSTIVPSPFPTRLSTDGVLHVTGLHPAQVTAAHLFPITPGTVIDHAPQRLGFDADGLTLSLSPAPAPGFTPGHTLTGLLELTDHTGITQSLTIAAAVTAAATPLALWLALAFAGGLILNLMPCVFPILAMKTLAIARLSGAARPHIRREATAYTAGILTAMLALGTTLLTLRTAGAAVGWGFQLQSPIFTGLMALLILALSLNLAGAFEITGLSGLANAFQGRSSYFTGLLAVAVATPCTAPFMGGALAAALAAPPLTGLAIFLCLGLGLAAPFLLLALLPHLATWLPRPGPWMAWLQRLLAIPMFATFLWLAWVFTTQLTPAAALTLPHAEPYTPARLAALRAAGTPVLVDMTAGWCLTCLVNDHTTLANPAVQSTLAAHHIHLLIGDWTNRNPAITAYLQTNHRDGVPLYVFYPARSPPRLLPQILTPAIATAALTAGPAPP